MKKDKVVKRLSINAEAELKGWGRNGIFNVGHATLSEMGDGSINLSIFSTRPGKQGPIQLAGSKETLLQLMCDIETELTKF